jgi:hypothetical protein
MANICLLFVVVCFGCDPCWCLFPIMMRVLRRSCFSSLDGMDENPSVDSLCQSWREIFMRLRFSVPFFQAFCQSSWWGVLCREFGCFLCHVFGRLWLLHLRGEFLVVVDLVWDMPLGMISTAVCIGKNPWEPIARLLPTTQQPGCLHMHRLPPSPAFFICKTYEPYITFNRADFKDYFL